MRDKDKPHSYRHELSALRELLTHGHGDEEVDGEVQPGVETVIRGGGGGPWRRRRGGDMMMAWRWRGGAVAARWQREAAAPA